MSKFVMRPGLPKEYRLHITCSRKSRCGISLRTLGFSCLGHGSLGRNTPGVPLGFIAPRSVDSRRERKNQLGENGDFASSGRSQRGALTLVHVCGRPIRPLAHSNRENMNGGKAVEF
jgi:hypothetical protein